MRAIFCIPGSRLAAMDDSEDDDRGLGESPERPLKGQACRHTASKSSNDDEREDGANDGQERPSGSEGSPSKKKSRDNIPEPLSSLHGFVPESPPRFVSLEQIMTTANGVTNMMLAHEIVMDDTFKLKKQEYPEKSLEHEVKKILHQAFWQVLEDQLAESPPNYDQAMQLLQEAKETLLGLLLPHNTSLRAEIMEGLDVALVRQQAEHGTLDFGYYARLLISLMARMCAPVRDASVRDLLKIEGVVPLFRGIMDQLEVMKLDMVNFTIQEARPLIQSHSVGYAREKFRTYLETQALLSPGSDPLVHTRAWLRRSHEELRALSAQYSPDPVLNGPGASGPPFAVVLAKAYIQLLCWDPSWEYPETLSMDRERFTLLGAQVEECALVASVLLVTHSVGGASLQDISDFKEDLRSHTRLLLQGCGKCSEEELTEKLKCAASQAIKEVQESLQKHGFAPLQLSQERMLYDQVVSMASAEHHIRKLLTMRILDFIKLTLSSASVGPTKIPAGLSTLEKELTQIAGTFLRLVTHNRAVFGEVYTDIMTQLRAT
ncbi:T-complex protein 11-like protein 1 [Ixodes scapularis]